MHFRSLAMALPVMLAAFGLSACNTMSGMGQDITGTANFVQGYMPPELQKGGGAYPGFPQPVAAQAGIPALSGL